MARVCTGDDAHLKDELDAVGNHSHNASASLNTADRLKSCGNKHKARHENRSTNIRPHPI